MSQGVVISLNREEWQAIKNKDKKYDGRFFYANKISKTICRPSCTARICSPKNVVILSSLEEGIAMGFHPCRRCCPEKETWEGPKAELAASARRWIEDHYTEKFSLKMIADELFVDGSYLLRVFKAQTGYTLLQYHNTVRCEKAKELLQQPELSIALISCRVGYSSASHFSRIFHNICGCTPSEYRTSYLTELDLP